MIAKLQFRVASLAGILLTCALSAQTVVEFGGLSQLALGTASLSVSSNGLSVSNLGSSGQDGVAIGLQELTRAATVQFSPVNLGATGAELAFSLSGMVNDAPGQSLGKVSLQRNGLVTDLVFDAGQMPVATTLRVEVYNHNTLVRSAVVPAGGLLGRVSGFVRLISVTAGDANPSASQWMLFDLAFADVVSFSTPNASGNRLRVVALNPAGALQNLLRLDVTARNLDSLLIQEANAPQFQPRLRIERAGQRIRLNWDSRSAVLYGATSVTGPWRRMLEGKTSAELPISGRQKCFRLLVDPSAFPEAMYDLPFVRKRNILLVIADDVGVDQIPWYINYYETNSTLGDEIPYTTSAGNPGAYTPVIDKLAASGVTFLNAWSSPLCSPTRASLFTGNHCFRHGVYSPEVKGARLLDTIEGGATTTIAKMLANEGYTNALFGKWHLGGETVGMTTYGNRPSHFGWGHYKGSLGGGVGDYKQWDKVVNDEPATTCYTLATVENTGDAIAWIKTQPVTQPWMVTVAFNAPHDPWDFHSVDYQARTDTDSKAKYRSVLEALDRSLGRILGTMPRSYLEQTTIIFMGDNGTPVDDMGTKNNRSDDTPISDCFSTAKCKGTLYEAGVNVPFIIADGYTYVHGEESHWSMGKGRVVSPGRVESALVQTLDVFATAAEIGRGISDTGKDSVSMVPYLQSASAAPERDVIFTETRKVEGKDPWEPEFAWVSGDSGWDVAVRGTTYKLIVKNYDSGGSEEYELYDLSMDRWENNNLSGGSLTTAQFSARILLGLALQDLDDIRIKTRDAMFPVSFP